jgi:ribose 5-phosphate isomerase
MAKLNKVNTYAILWLNQSGHTAEQIVEELGVTEKQVSSVLADNVQPSSTTSKTNAKNLMITHTSGKKLNNVAIMTKDASSIGDETRKQATTSPGRNQEKNIFRPNNK